MRIDIDTVKRVAKLARIAVDDEAAEHLSGDLSALFTFVDQLNEVEINNVEPLTSVEPMVLRMREDQVTDGNYAEKIVANAPLSEENYILVPKVVE